MITDFPTREESVLADILAAQAAARPDQVYAVFSDSTWTFAEAAAQAWKLANV